MPGFAFSITTDITARKTIFSKSWNIMESSKRPSKYHLSINFWLNKGRISHHQQVQNKNFSATSKYHLSINFLAQKSPYFPFPKRPKQELFSSQYHLSSNFLAQKRPYSSFLKRSRQELFSN